MKTKRPTDDDKVDDYVARELYDEDVKKIQQLDRLSAPWDMRLLFFGFSIVASDQADAEAKVVELRKKLRTDIARWKHWRQHPDLRTRVDEQRARKLTEAFDMPRIRHMRSNYEDYSLALLAGVAAHLLNGNNYRVAATRAFGLLDACSDHLSVVDWNKRIATEQALALPKYRTVPLELALRKITGTDNAADATGYYREFLRKTRFEAMTDEEAAAARSICQMVFCAGFGLSPASAMQVKIVVARMNGTVFMGCLSSIVSVAPSRRDVEWRILA